MQDVSGLSREECIEKPIAIGGRSWVSVHCHPENYIHWEHHQVSTVVGIAGVFITLLVTAYVRNKDEQKRSDGKALKALKSSETRYKDLVDNTSVLIQSINTETGMLSFANQGWKDALGYGDDEIARLNFAGIIHPDELDHCTKILKSAIKTQKAQAVETIFVRKGGDLLNIEGHIVCRKNESGMMVTHGVFSDITERRKAELLAEKKQKQLLASEQQYHSLFDQLPLEIWEEDWSPIRDDIIALHDQGIDIVDYAENHPERIKDLERRTVVTSVNDGALKMNKAASLEELETYYDANPELAFTFLPALKAFLDGQLSASCEGYQRILNNKERYLQSTTFISEGSEDDWTRVISLTSDITEIKESQAQVIQASKLATLGEMATSVAHELNQPLNVIRMAAGNSRRKVKKGNPDLEYLDQKLERIETQTARAAAIIDHMRMFGRKAEEKPEEIDPRKVITNAIDLMGEQLRLAGIEVVTDFPDKCSKVFGHTIQVEQVVINLLTNARDAMTDREGDSKITLRVSEDEAGVHISCQDTGGGIPKDVIPRIFEPFYTTKEMGKGTGLGLSVSYGIIRDIGGSIVAENVDGGARFTIKLPLLSGEK